MLIRRAQKCAVASDYPDYSENKIRLKFTPNSPAPNFEPDWNKAPNEPMPVAIRSVEGERVPKMIRWGLIPH